MAARLGVSTSGLVRGGVTEALTSDQIKALIEAKPEWLIAERETCRKARIEEQRLKALRAAKA